MNLIKRARVFASMRHTGQVRKYTGEPYVNHLLGVVRLVSGIGASDEMIAAAWLHDVLEDTETNVAELIDLFGEDVTMLVVALTDQYTKETWPNFNRAQRKEMERKRLAKVSPNAQTIKVADLIDNTSTIVERDPKFAKTYLEEKRLLLEVLTKANPILLNTARGMTS
jgi:(p)ppGpp synthase/HD superfamily hydrolase